MLGTNYRCVLIASVYVSLAYCAFAGAPSSQAGADHFNGTRIDPIIEYESGLPMIVHLANYWKTHGDAIEMACNEFPVSTDLIIEIVDLGLPKYEYLVGLFEDPLFEREPIAVFLVQGIGKHTLVGCPTGSFYIGALGISKASRTPKFDLPRGLIGLPARLCAQGCHLTWPKPVEITKESAPEIVSILLKDRSIADKKRELIKIDAKYFDSGEDIPDGKAVPIKVVDQGGKPVLFCEVLLDKKGKGDWDKTGLDGIAWLNRDVLTSQIEVKHHQFIPTNGALVYVTQKVDIADQIGEPEMITVTLRPFALGSQTVTGHWRDQHGPVTGKLVFESRTIRYYLPVHSQDGYYKAENVPDGRYWVFPSPHPSSDYEHYTIEQLTESPRANNLVVTDDSALNQTRNVFSPRIEQASN